MARLCRKTLFAFAITSGGMASKRSDTTYSAICSHSILPGIVSPDLLDIIASNLCRPFASELVGQRQLIAAQPRIGESRIVGARQSRVLVGERRFVIEQIGDRGRDREMRNAAVRHRQI